ncbi:MAG TPA: isocitrate lyase/phosphoenolpyruvate mutase family protein [Steroidobacteraceae bacterium]|jgi:2-methylisocitrate lyase-like PEP mutase family enzyme|nr:isocitrate lyase/phosphoenolpyruvate mutase family protein [Steroidobacteraceae bacterium]
MDEKTQAERAQRFRALHDGGTFVIANCWDGGSARILAAMGFPALATSSGAAAGMLGRLDHGISIDESLANARMICDNTKLPVSGDLEKGFGDAPAAAAKAINLAARAGLVGGSIEDATGRKEAPIFDLGFATERVAAAVEAVRALPFPFTLTARAENYLHGKPDIDDTVKRLQAYEAAGADVLFAPGLPDLAAIRLVCSSVGKPVNFMVGIRGKSFSLAELAAAGVRRVSFATSLYRAAMSGLVTAAREIRESGTFGYLDSTMSSADFAKFVQGNE